MTLEQASSNIKQAAKQLGFAACGIAKAEAVDEDAVKEQEDWLAQGYAAGMEYMHNHKDLRYDPRLLHPGSRSLIVVAMNYYPSKLMDSDISFAYYSYGKDYHFVLKSYLNRLYDYIERDVVPNLTLTTPFDGRAFVDSAPIMERYWAKKAGVGFQGRNRLIIVPKVGSYCFLGILAVNIDLSYDSPLNIGCGKCHRCEEGCPTNAICNGFVDSNKCISYQTIENKSESIPENVAEKMGDRVYGCDACQQVCPWNRFAHPTSVDEFQPDEKFLRLDSSDLEKMTSGDFKRMFKSSAITRAGLKGLKRNVESVKKTLSGLKNDK